ncbi:hypothetical protein [Spirillospora sp. CA-294931]|uniref:hypothetical protein n=1 Tax=Spirillospora sp. CA-294931 TaxID=3240042 RepID=UPI003D8E72F9
MAAEQDYGFRQLGAKLGLARWQLRLAKEHSLLPEPDHESRWSFVQAEECARRVPEILAAFGDEPPIGAEKAAARLATRVGLDVDRPDIEVLVARGVLTLISRYQGHPVYLLRDLDAIDAETVMEIVAARKGPLLDTVDPRGAAMILGWPKSVFNRLAAEHRLTTDQLGRYALDDVRLLADDPELAKRARAEQARQAEAKARRVEERFESSLRTWLLKCTAYLDRTTADPPDLAPMSRALRSLTASRSLTPVPPEVMADH